MDYILLAFVALLPVTFSILFFILDKSTRFGKLSYRTKQIIWGFVFGFLAVLGTECSIPLEGSTAAVNCRDAAVITAGLFFGAPAGIIAGIIGAAERWFAALWGVGIYTRVACSVSTLLAGVFSALLRKYFIENKKPEWHFSLLVGVVIEVFHMLMVFFTHMESPDEAMNVIRACTLPMVLANGTSVMLSSIFLFLLENRDRNKVLSGRNKVHISQTIQRWLLLSFIAAFLVTFAFVFKLQDKMSSIQADKLLTMALDETISDIRDASDTHLLSIAYDIATDIDSGTYHLSDLAELHGVDEINFVNREGIIFDSSENSYVGFNVADGEQSSEFICLLKGRENYTQEYRATSMNSKRFMKYVGVKYDFGYIQVGFSFAQLKREIDQEIVGITKNRHVGETGYILIIDEHFNVVSAPRSLDLKTLQEAVIDDMKGEEITFSATLNESDCRLRYRQADGYYIVSVLPAEEVLYMRNMALYVNSFTEIIILAILFVVLYLLLKVFVVDRIKQVNSSLADITDGNLDEVVNVRSNQEFAELSDDINMTVDTLKRYIDEASKRIDQELEFAKNIQRSALPLVTPALSKRNDFEVFASMDPAKEVGGDFFDFYLTDNDHFSFLVADVSGKGIPAAMFMMRAKTELKSLTESGLNLSDVFTRGNASLCDGNDAGMFVTVWQGVIDLTNGIVHYANAGHNPPLVRHMNGKFEFLKMNAGFILGGLDDIHYVEHELRLQPGDIVFLYTDGVTEATNADDELYGEDRLRDTLNRIRISSMEELCLRVKADLANFVEDAPQFDDITMLAIRYTGSTNVNSVSFDEAVREDVTSVISFIEQQMEDIDCSVKDRNLILSAIDEIFSNIVKYGYKDCSGPITVEFAELADMRAVQIRVTDEAVEFNPLEVPEPDITLPIESRTEGGLGIFLVKKTMDDVQYKYENGKNILTLVKKL